MDAKESSHEGTENNVNSANKKKYSLRSPGMKLLSNDTTGVGALAGMIESMADNSTFSIHSEGESIASKANTPSRSGVASHQASRRSSIVNDMGTEDSLEIAEEASFGFGKSPAANRRVTADAVDLQALMANLDDSQSSLDISMSSRVSAASVNTVDLLQNTSRMLGSPSPARSTRSARKSQLSSLYTHSANATVEAAELSGLSHISSSASSLDISAVSATVAAVEASTPLTGQCNRGTKSPRGSARKSTAEPSPAPLASGLNDSTWNALNALRTSAIAAPDTPASATRSHSRTRASGPSPAPSATAPLLDFSGLNDSGIASVKSSAKGSAKKGNRRETADFTEMRLLDDSALDASIASATKSPAKGRGKRDTRRDTADFTDVRNLLDDSALDSVASAAAGHRQARRETVDAADMLHMLEDSALNASADSVVGFGRRNVGRESVETASLDTLLLNLSDGSAQKSVVRDARRETVDPSAYMHMLQDLSGRAEEAPDRRQTVDPRDVSSLLNLSASVEEPTATGVLSSVAVPEESSAVDESRRDSAGSVGTVALLRCVADTLHGLDSSVCRPSPAHSVASSLSLDLSALNAMVHRGAETPFGAGQASPGSAPSTISFSIAGRRATNRETADTSDLRLFAEGLLAEQEAGESEAGEDDASAVDYLSCSRLSAHSQSFTKTAPAAGTATALVLAAQKHQEDNQDTVSQADTASQAGTVNAADLDMDLLNDSMSTNESIATIGTVDLLDRVESAMLADHLLELANGYVLTGSLLSQLCSFLTLYFVCNHISASDAESEMTTDTLPLDEILRQDTDMDTEEVGLAVAQGNSRGNSTASARSNRSVRLEHSTASSVAATPASAVASQPASSVQGSGSSVQDSVSTGGSKRRRSEGGTAGDTVSTIPADESVEHSFDLSRDLSASRSRLLPLRGHRARASLSTSVVQAQGDRTFSKPRSTQRRASVGPITTSASSLLAAHTVSSASKTKTKTVNVTAVEEFPVPPSPAPAAAVAAPRQPAVSIAFNVPVAGSALKSCLSSRKKPRPDNLSSLRFDLDTSLTASAIKRNVVFGSPQACEFNKTSPTTSYTPMNKDAVKGMFSMAPSQKFGAQGEEDFVSADPETQENDAVMDEWERLTNGSEYGSDEEAEGGMQGTGMAGIPEGSEEGSVSSRGAESRRSSTGSASSGRRLSMLQPMVDLSVSDASQVVYEERAAGELELSTSQFGEDATGTVCLPSSLAEVLRQNAIIVCTPTASAAAPAAAQSFVAASTDTSMISEHTEEIEMDMQALLRKLQKDTAPEADEDELSVASSVSASSSSNKRRRGRRVSVLQAVQGLPGDLSLSQLDDSDASAHLGSLLGRASDASSSALATADSSLVVSEDTNTSRASSRSTRSTRSTRSVASAKADTSTASVEPSAEKSSNRRGRKRSSAGSAADISVSVDVSAAAAAAVDISLGDDPTYALEGSLAALVRGLHPSTPAAEPAPVAAAVESAVDADASDLVADASGPVPMEVEDEFAAQEISVIAGANGVMQVGEGDGFECDFSQLLSPRASMGAPAVAASPASASVASNGTSRVTRRSTRASHDKSRMSDVTHDTFGEFSLLASNEEEEENARAQAGVAAGPGGLMSRLRNLNAGARNNSLLQAGAPSVRAAESRMSIGIKRQSILATNANLNTSLNASAMHYAAPMSAAKSGKKPRHSIAPAAMAANALPESPVQVTQEPPAAKTASPTPSMSNVYGNGSPSSIRYSANPMRPSKPAVPLAEEEAAGAAMAVVAEDVEGECVEDSFQETELLESEMNDTITDYEVASANVRERLFAHFSAVQTVKTLLSAYRPEVRDMVRACMVAAIPGAYVDSVLSQVPLEGLLLAWELSPQDSEDFAEQVLARHPDCYKHQRMQFADRGADQLWVNTCAAAVLSQTSALQATLQAADADKFYNKALNRVPSRANAAVNAVSTGPFSAQQLQERQALRAQLTEKELLIDIVNKLTYCRVTTFQSSCVKVTAMLSPTVDASVAFTIDRQGDQLVVSGILVDLAIAQGKSTPKAVTAQNLFVSAYFASVMTADDVEGCLSTTTLNAVEEPRDIPPLLHKVGGSTFSV
jgi:hypothetical protein